MIHIHWTNVITDYCPKRGETTWALVTHLFSNTPGLLCSDVTGLFFFSCACLREGPLDNTALCVCVSERHSHHLIVLLRFGWLTVLSSMKMVEQELYFFESGPGDTFTHLKKQNKNKTTKNNTINLCWGDRQSRMLPTFPIFRKLCVIIVLF